MLPTKQLTQLAVLGVALVFVAIQFVPVQRSTRLGAGDPTAPREVAWILRRACYDCHSTETRWPIWAYVAPVSWRVVADVNRARAALNFSDWVAYEGDRRVALRATVGAVTASHRMPLWYYVTLHPDARLSESEHALLRNWAQRAAAERQAPPR